MYVLSAEECLHQVLVLAEVCHDAKFYLAVVGREEELPLVGDEGFAHLLAHGIAHGDVLQVGVGGGQASRGGDGLVEGGVYVSRGGIDQFGQGIDVCAQQFLQSSVLQYLAHHLVLVAQALQHFLAGNVLSGLRLLGLGIQLEHVEEDFAHLPGRGDVEPLSCQPVYLFLQVHHFLGEVAACLCQPRFVYAYTRLLHACQYAHQGHLHLPEDVPKACVVQLLLEEFLQFLLCGFAVGILQIVKSVAHFWMQEVVRYGGVKKLLLPYSISL